MNLLEQLDKKLTLMHDEYHFLIEENKRLREVIKELQSKNDFVTKNSQDMLLSIQSRLKSKGIDIEKDYVSHQ
ncbi:MAG: hypothetical protein IE909_02990 [Campylobacterales bacterium]|nr:hypothetical protein [Campylobacterales bacterium]